jgi:hypothetical protein
MNIRKLLGLCEHKWKIIFTANVSRYIDNSIVGQNHTLQCEKCGMIKVKKVRI